MWWALSLAWAALIYWLSDSPDAHGGLSLIDLEAPLDKFVHASVFGVMAMLLRFATGRPWLAFGLVALFGVSDELHQASVPGRAADVWDWVADTIGAAVAVWLVGFLTRQDGASAKSVE